MSKPADNQPRLLPIRGGRDTSADEAVAAEHVFTSHSYLAVFTIVENNLGDILDGRKLEYDEFAQSPTLSRRAIVDEDLSALRAEIERRFSDAASKKRKGLQFSTADVYSAVAQVARRHSFHPVRDYLQRLAWDGTPRLADLPHRFGAAHTPLVAAMFRRTLIAAIARAMSPGCKVDTVLILVGPQGIGKSRSLQILARDEWFSDSHIDIGSKDGYQALRGRWLVELSELDALRRARDTEAIKAFLSSAIDRYRDSYGRLARDYPRTCIFVGSTNDPEFLTDPTGGRRFWPVAVTTIDLGWLERHRDQLWAEATHAWSQGERWWLDRHEDRDLAVAQIVNSVQHPWTPLILAWVLDRAGEITTAEVLEQAIHKPAGQWTDADAKRVAAVLRPAGWEQAPRRHRGGRTWTYTGILQDAAAPTRHDRGTSAAPRSPTVATPATPDNTDLDSLSMYEGTGEQCGFLLPQAPRGHVTDDQHAAADAAADAAAKGERVPGEDDEPGDFPPEDGWGRSGWR